MITALRTRLVVTSLALVLSGGHATAQKVAPPANDTLTQIIPSLTFGGVTPVYDEAGKRYLLSLATSQRYRATPKAVMNHTDTNGYRLVVGGKVVHVGDSASFVASFDNPKGVRQTLHLINSKGDTVATAAFVGTFMPVIALNTAPDINGKVYTVGNITVNDAEHRGTEGKLTARLRYRGATAQSMSKKAFAVKLIDEAGKSIDGTFGGLREDNDWILDAMAVDLARMRNRVSTDLWNDFSAKPAHFAAEPKAINGTRGFFVEIVLNGRYQGLYCMTEKIDRKQLRLKKFATSGDAVTLRGLLYKADHWSYATFMGHGLDSEYYPGVPPAKYDNMSDAWEHFEMAYPEVADGETIDWAPLYNAVSAVASNDTATFRKQAAKLFDLPVALDYYLFVELMLASDNHGKNMFYHIYDVSKKPMLGITPWDLDGTWGRDYYSRNHTTGDPTQSYTQYLITHEHGEHGLYKRLREGAYPGWNEALAARYAELRKGHFHPDSLVARFARYTELFVHSGADQRERIRWSGADKRTFHIPTETLEIATWVQKRVAALDKQYAYDPTITHIATPRATSLQTTTSLGQLTLASPVAKAVTLVRPDGAALWSGIVTATPITIALPKGIYIVDGRKVVVP
ncbi:MAG: CotH kinase family protein [Bacteroidales bacterium]|nr:CotH kinase family protein [Bacteroidales bacterium]